MDTGDITSCGVVAGLGTQEVLVGLQGWGSSSVSRGETVASELLQVHENSRRFSEAGGCH